jgi:hypothetical protein
MKTMIDSAKKAVRDATSSVTGSEKGAILPYGIAWLLGVPVTILVIIYLLRGG